MEYTTVYVTSNKDRINLLKSHFEREKLDYRVVPTTAKGDKGEEVAIEIAEKDRERARQILHDTGFLKIETAHDSASKYKPERKLIPIVIAAIILILVVITIWWLMNSPTVD